MDKEEIRRILRVFLLQKIECKKQRGKVFETKKCLEYKAFLEKNNWNEFDLLKNSPFEIKNDKIFIMKLIKIHENCIKHISDNLKNDREVISLAISKNFELFKFASNELQNDPYIIIKLLENIISQIDYENKEDLYTWNFDNIKLSYLGTAFDILPKHIIEEIKEHRTIYKFIKYLFFNRIF